MKSLIWIRNKPEWTKVSNLEYLEIEIEIIWRLSFSMVSSQYVADV